MTDNKDYKEYKEFMARVCTVAHEETNDLKKKLDITKDQAIGLYIITMIDKLTSTLAMTSSDGNRSAAPEESKQDTP
tara:strand:- start:270 stop:500 length:231 start_codon:yes stop_codon:yes gene_type:complete